MIVFLLGISGIIYGVVLYKLNYFKLAYVSFFMKSVESFTDANKVKNKNDVTKAISVSFVFNGIVFSFIGLVSLFFNNKANYLLYVLLGVVSVLISLYKVKKVIKI